MARLGTKYFTRGKIMIGVAAEGFNRPLIPFDPTVDNVDVLELTKMCEGITKKQADELLEDLTKFFVDHTADRWLELPGFVDLAATKRIRVTNKVAA